MPSVERVGDRVDFHYEGQHLTPEDVEEWARVWQERQQKLHPPEEELAIRLERLNGTPTTRPGTNS